MLFVMFLFLACLSGLRVQATAVWANVHKRIQPPEFGLALYWRTTSTLAYESHTHTRRCGTPEPLTQPVFAGNLAKSLPVGLPSSEEVDRAVLPALYHLQRQRQREKEWWGSEFERDSSRIRGVWSSSPSAESPSRSCSSNAYLEPDQMKSSALALALARWIMQTLKRQFVGR